VALVRVYCGISSAAEPGLAGSPARLTVAVVDDSGRPLEFCEIHDDPAGYAVITALIAERFSGSATIMFAVDSDEHLVGSLLAAAGRSIAYTDDESADEFAQQFCSDEEDSLNESVADRRGLGLARALHAGILSATVSPAPRELVALKPVIAAHSALTVGRQAAATALREVLRELYPAALRAYPDPAEPVALAMLDALPEPGLLGAASGKGRDTAVTVAARLVADGLCDNDAALEAVNALRVAIAETPRRNGATKQLTSAVSDAVRASVAAVRSADAAVSILIATLAERIAPTMPVPATSTARRRVPPTPVTTPAAAPRPVAPPPVAPAAVSPAPMVYPAPVASSRPAWAQSTPPPQLPPGFEPTPVTGSPQVPSRSAPLPPRVSEPVPPQRVSEPLATPFVPTLTNAAINSERASRGLGPVAPAPEDAPSFPEPVAFPEPVVPVSPALVAAPGSRANWPLVGDAADELRPNRVTPPWQADDLVLPPALRLVEPVASVAPGATAVPVRLVDDSALTSRIPKVRHNERSQPALDDDTDLLIFSSVSSAWFSADDGESTWNSGMDTGWRVAEEASLRPSIGGDTTAGLPRRVPSANLVPGSAALAEHPLRIVRDAGEIAAHTSNYFRGSRRGNQEAGSYAVGGRPGRESANGWDFSREHDVRGHDVRGYDGRGHDIREYDARNYYDDRGEYGQRAASYR
jgi:hypothetical protein